MTADTLLEDLQADVVAILANTPALADAHVMLEDEGNMETKIAKKLGALNAGDTEKRGLVLVVLQPDVTDPDENLPGPPVAVELQVQIIEQPLINRGASGTGIRSSVAGLRTLHALHLQALGNLLLVTGKKPLTTVKVKPGFLSHMVTMELRNCAIGGAEKVLGVSAAVSGSMLTLSCATSGAVIYFSTDGRYPTPADGARYTAAFALPEAGTVIRAAAYKTDLNPSDCLEMTVTA